MSTMTVTEIVTDRTTEWVTEDGDHDKEAHIVVPASAVMEAAVTGVPCRAICGKSWVPNRDPEAFPVCKLCIEVYEQATGQPWTGRR